MAKKSNAPACKSFEDGTRDIKLVLSFYHTHVEQPLRDLKEGAEGLQSLVGEGKYGEAVANFGHSMNAMYLNARRMADDNLVIALYRAATERS